MPSPLMKSPGRRRALQLAGTLATNEMAVTFNIRRAGSSPRSPSVVRCVLPQDVGLPHVKSTGLPLIDHGPGTLATNELF